MPEASKDTAKGSALAPILGSNISVKTWEDQ